jgi:hypothetical protein
VRGKDIEWCAGYGRGVPRKRKINLLEQSQAQFSHIVRQDTPTNSNLRTASEVRTSFIYYLLFDLFIIVYFILILSIFTNDDLWNVRPYRAWVGATRQMAELSLADIEAVDVRELGWAGHIVVCGCLRGIAQFIAPLREVPRPFCSFARLLMLTLSCASCACRVRRVVCVSCACAVVMDSRTSDRPRPLW